MKKPELLTISDAIDDYLIETEKHYLLLGQATQMLLDKGIISNKKVFKKIIEQNEIPQAYQTKGTRKQWRIPLSKEGLKRKNELETKIEKKEIIIKKPALKAKKVEITNPFKIILYIVAILLWIAAISELTEFNSSEFSWTFFLFTLIFGIFIINKAKKIKPITSTNENLSNSALNDNEIYYVNSQNNNKSKKNARTVARNVKSNINEDDVYGLAYDLAGEGIEDEVRDNIEYEIKDYDHHYDDSDKFDEYEKH